jgi:hypothetical protein
MQPTEVDAIASAVIGSLAGPEPGLLGCGAVSGTADYVCGDGPYACSGGGGYECGGAALFRCNGPFDCGSAGAPAGLFYCEGPQGSGLYTCMNTFNCVSGFAT